MIVASDDLLIDCIRVTWIYDYSTIFEIQLAES